VIGIAAAGSMLAALSTSAPRAHAGEPRTPAHESGRASASPSVSRDARCRTPRTADGADGREGEVALLFAEYQCRLGAGEYRAALAALERACAGSEDAACSFNRALVHHTWLELPGELDREHCRVARWNYARYLTLEPYEEQSDAARSALVELEGICEPERAPSVSAAPSDPDVIRALQGPPLGDLHAAPPNTSSSHERSPPAPTTGQHSPRPPHSTARPLPAEPSFEPEPRGALPWLLLGAGSASALATAAAWLNMSRADSDLSRHARTGVVFANPETEALDASRRRYRSLVLGFGAGALTLLGAGATLLVIEPALPPYLSLGIAPGVAIVGYDGAF
jgi:hypothetical protein